MQHIRNREWAPQMTNGREMSVILQLEHSDGLTKAISRHTGKNGSIRHPKRRVRVSRNWRVHLRTPGYGEESGVRITPKACNADGDEF